MIVTVYSNVCPFIKQPGTIVLFVMQHRKVALGRLAIVSSLLTPERINKQHNKHTH